MVSCTGALILPTAGSFSIYVDKASTSTEDHKDESQALGMAE